jgi:hypothetical protein
VLEIRIKERREMILKGIIVERGREIYRVDI